MCGKAPCCCCINLDFYLYGWNMIRVITHAFSPRSHRKEGGQRYASCATDSSEDYNVFGLLQPSLKTSCRTLIDGTCCFTILRWIERLPKSLCTPPRAIFGPQVSEPQRLMPTRFSNQTPHRPRETLNFGLFSVPCVSAFLCLPSSYPLSLPHFLPSPMLCTRLSSLGSALLTLSLRLHSSQ